VQEGWEMYEKKSTQTRPAGRNQQSEKIIMKKMDMQTELTHYQHMFLDQLEERLECPEKTYSKEWLTEKIQQTNADIDRNLGFS
jgi:hypothetical protein